MKKFLMILLPQKVHIYKSIDNNEFEVFYINGEEILNWSSETYCKDFSDLKREILDTCNFDNLSEVGFDVIYHQVDTDIIKQLSDTLLPCAWWQLFNFEKILPELLLKMKKIKPNESVSVEFQDTNYLVSMSCKGDIQNCISDEKSEFNIDVKSIPLILKNSYDFIDTKQDIEGKELLISNLTKANYELKNNVDILESKIKQKDAQVTKGLKVIEKLNEEIKGLKHFISENEKNDKRTKEQEFIKSRTIIRAKVPEIYGEDKENKGYRKSGSTWYRYVNRIDFIKGNGEFIENCDIIAEIKQEYFDANIINPQRCNGTTLRLQATTDGRLFTMVKNGQYFS